MFRGSSKCQGCGRPATEAPRESRLTLCNDCHQLLLLGAAVTAKHRVDAIVTHDGDVWCGGQKCVAYKTEETRCQDCPMTKVWSRSWAKLKVVANVLAITFFLSIYPFIYIQLHDFLTKERIYHIGNADRKIKSPFCLLHLLHFLKIFWSADI